MIKIGIIGLGHWGPNYFRTFNSLNGVKVVWCSDLVEENLNKIRHYPDISLTKNYMEILADNSVAAVVVATPAATHYNIVRQCLNAEKDVLAEKPLALKLSEALELCKLADEKNRILMVGHTFLFNPGIRKIKEFIDSGELGRIYYLNATRTHLGLIREDVNAVWDLAAHDISIFNYLIGKPPLMVDAIGACHLKRGREDVAFINLTYPDNVIANIHVSWEDSNKERTVRIVGGKARIVFNDLDNMERVKIYEKGFSCEHGYSDYGEFQLFLRDGDIISPKIEMSEPLKLMCSNFIESVIKRTRSISDGKNGYEVVKALYAIEKSLADKCFIKFDELRIE